jgi:hypothetical protein
MAILNFVEEHNQVAYLQKSNEKSGHVFYQIVDFLNTTHIRYVLTVNPTIFVSDIKQFWNTVESITLEQGDTHKTVEALRATVDGVTIDVTESSLRRILQLDDLNGIITLPNSDIFKNIASMGYDTSDQKVTFRKGCFSPHWRFFIHTLLHYLSPKKTSYEQFALTMAYPLVCLATDRTFNFSKFIFNNIKGNVKSSYKFLMYPRFVQAVLNEFQLQPHKRIYETPCLKPKVFQNMCKASELWNGEVHSLFPQMLAKISQVQGEDATIPVVSQHTHYCCSTNIPLQSLTHMRGGKNNQLLSSQHCMLLNLLVYEQAVVVQGFLLVQLEKSLNQCPMIHLSQQVTQLEVVRAVCN